MSANMIWFSILNLDIRYWTRWLSVDWPQESIYRNSQRIYLELRIKRQHTREPKSRAKSNDHHERPERDGIMITIDLDSLEKTRRRKNLIYHIFSSLITSLSFGVIDFIFKFFRFILYQNNQKQLWLKLNYTLKTLLPLYIMRKDFNNIFLNISNTDCVIFREI